MSAVPIFKSAEPLYIVMVRLDNAQNLISKWVKKTKAKVTVENNRMKFFESYSLSLFQLEWEHGWDKVTIWDCWNKRHIY